jgi:hypothetical protein
MPCPAVDYRGACWRNRADVICVCCFCLCLLQLFVPLISPHVSSPATAAEPAAARGQQHQQQHPVAGVFSLLEEVALRQTGGLTGEDIDRGIGQPLEQLGVSLTFGECLLCTTCAFVKSAAACVQAVTT